MGDDNHIFVHETTNVGIERLAKSGHPSLTTLAGEVLAHSIISPSLLPCLEIGHGCSAEQHRSLDRNRLLTVGCRSAGWCLVVARCVFDQCGEASLACLSRFHLLLHQGEQGYNFSTDSGNSWFRHHDNSTNSTTTRHLCYTIDRLKIKGYRIHGQLQAVKYSVLRLLVVHCAMLGSVAKRQVVYWLEYTK